MKEYRVRFLPDDRAVTVTEGISLLDAAFQAGIIVDSSCGGKGYCKKCRMEILEGEQKGGCMACQTKVHSAMTVRILRQERNAKILTGTAGKMAKADTGIKVCILEGLIAELHGPESVWEKARDMLTEKTGVSKERFTVSLTAARKMYQEIMRGKEKVYAVLYQNEMIDISAEEPAPAVFAVDMGTTTLAGYLIDALTGRILSRVSARNPQARYGADVISRADYVLAHGGREMAACIRKAVDSLAVTAAENAGYSAESIYVTVLVGNTCMHHLFLEINPESLVKAPYIAAVRHDLELPAEPYLKKTAPGGKLKLLPNIAGFVGADTTACLVACDFLQEEKMTLLMDIGTNGELVLGNRDRAVSCSTAAGPAFEGARISCGMRGVLGAIDHVAMENGRISFSVLGGGEPEGICGSGLLDLAAVLSEYDLADEMGIMETPEFVLYENAETGKRISITQKDISEIQLAKAAMAAGIRILCRHMGIEVEEIEQVMIAGAFGNYLNPSSACRIGLIPMVLKDKIKAVGNAAGEGALLAALNKEKWEYAKQAASSIEFVELASEPDFSDLFVEELAFPKEDEGQ